MGKLNFSILLGMKADGIKKGIAEANASINSFASSVRSAFGMIAGAFAAGQIKAFSKECLDAYSAQMQAETKLNTIMKQRMNASDAEVKSILQLTSAQQQLGVIGDEVQIAGAQQVATFLNSKKSLDTLIPAMNNLLTQQKGLSATQGDAVTIGNLMGKVMQGQTSALKRVGITFDENQEKMLKYGTEEQRAATLAQVITDNVGNMNSELAQTDMGKIQQMNNTLGDLKEKIGGAIAPIVSQLAPGVANVATTIADNITTIIGFIQENISGLIAYIVGQVAGIKLIQYIQSFVSQAKAQEAQLEASAAASVAKREALENRLATAKNRLLVLEAQEDEQTGAKKIATAQKVQAKKAEIAELEKSVDAAKNAEVTAQNELAAMKTASSWKKGMLIAKMSMKSFIFSVKTAFRSFAPLLIFEVLFNTLTAVYNQLMKSSQGFRNFVAILKGTVLVIVKKVASALGTVFNWLSKILGMDAGSEKKSSTNNKNTTSGKKTNGDANGSSSAGGTGGKVSTAKVEKELTAAQKAAQDVAEAEKNYSTAIKKAQGNITASANKEEAVTQAHQDQITALRSLYDAYSQAYAATGNDGYLKKMKEINAQLDILGYSFDAEKQVTDEHVKKEKDLIDHLEDNNNKKQDLQSKLSAAGKGTRDTTFDYKLSKNEKVQADLEFNLEKAKKQLEILQDDANKNIDGIDDMINQQLANVDSLEDALKLTKVQQDIKSLKKDLNQAILEGASNGWSAVKSVVSDVQSCVDTIEDPDASGWEKFSSVMDALFGILQSVQTVMETINTIQKLSTALTTADTTAKGINSTATTTNAATSVAASTTKSAANTREATTAGSAAVSEATKSGASLPFPANIAAIAAAVAAVVSALATVITAFSEGGIVGKGGVKHFAGGGLVTGATSHGDFIPSMLNSGEMVLNPSEQNRLFRLATGQSSQNGITSGSVKFEIEGRKLVGILGKEENHRARS